MSQPWTTKLRFISTSIVDLADGKRHWPSRMMMLLNYVLSLLGEWAIQQESWELSFELKGILGRRRDGCILSLFCALSFIFPVLFLSLSRPLQVIFVQRPEVTYRSCMLAGMISPCCSFWLCLYDREQISCSSYAEDQGYKIHNKEITIMQTWQVILILQQYTATFFHYIF